MTKNDDIKDWQPEQDAPVDKIVSLVIQDRVSVSGDFPPRTIAAFKKPNGKWYECTTSGIYVLHQRPTVFKFLPQLESKTP